MKVKMESEKVGLKLNIQKTKIMASGPITSWEIDGETVGTATDFIFLGSKITAGGDCSHETKRCLLLREILVAQMVKCLSAMEETRIRSLGWEDSLKKEMATHSSTLALKIPWTEKLGAGYPWGRKELGTTERLHFSFLHSPTLKSIHDHWKNHSLD